MPQGPRYRFHEFTFHPGTGALEGPGGSVRLAPRPALVLTILIESAGGLVTRTALQRRLWPDTIVEFDQGLNFCVRTVRSALGDRASEPRFIETLPRRGYRFIPPVTVEAVPSVRPPDAGTSRIRRVATLAATVAAASLAGHGRAAVPADPELDARAREAVEWGGYLLTRGQPEDIARSVRFFREATARAPGYGRAYAGLGSAYLQLERYEEGKRALHHSLAIDPDQWAPHLTLALHALYHDYDRARAGIHFERTRTLAPERVVVRHTYAWYLAISGRLDDALREMHAALSIDPVSPRVNGDIGRLFYLAGRYGDAAVHCRRTAQLIPGRLRAYDCVVHALLEQGRHAAARAEAAHVLEIFGSPAARRQMSDAASHGAALDLYWRWSAEMILERAGNGEDSYVHAAASWLRAGRVERAFDALDRAWAVRCPILPQIALDPAFDAVRADARFVRLLRRIGAMAPARTL